MIVQFFIPMKLPTATHQEKKWTVRKGKPYSYEPPAVQDARQKFTAYFSKFIPERKLKGPLVLTTQWIYLTDKKHPPKTWKATKPDTDNLVKLPKDVLTALRFWGDDGQVASETIQKFYDTIPGLHVRIEEIEP